MSLRKSFCRDNFFLARIMSITGDCMIPPLGPGPSMSYVGVGLSRLVLLGQERLLQNDCAHMFRSKTRPLQQYRSQYYW